MCRLAVSGKQLSAVTVTDPTSRSSPSNPSADLSHLEEEIFAQNGDVEEIFAIDTVSLAGSVHCFIQGLCRVGTCPKQPLPSSPGRKKMVV